MHLNKFFTSNGCLNNMHNVALMEINTFKRKIKLERKQRFNHINSNTIILN